jgi:hypothetical protein
VKKLYADGVFPDMGGVTFAEIIALCWRQEVDSAKMISRLVLRPSEESQLPQGRSDPMPGYIILKWEKREDATCDDAVKAILRYELCTKTDLLIKSKHFK